MVRGVATCLEGDSTEDDRGNAGGGGDTVGEGTVPSAVRGGGSRGGRGGAGGGAGGGGRGGTSASGGCGTGGGRSASGSLRAGAGESDALKLKGQVTLDCTKGK